MLTNDEIRLLTGLRHELHGEAELSNHEFKTKAALMRFIRENTSLEVRDMGRWFYAVHDEHAGKTAAVRADFDAVEVGCEARHLCGHDGHSAALCGLALLLEKNDVGSNVILLFQHAEETGDGAKECLTLFDREKIGCIIGCHNIPGEPMGTVLLKRGTFACASCGMEIAMHGAPTHAAYPENGADPTEALSRLSLEMPKIAKELSLKYACMTLSTHVGTRIGECAFGVAAADGSVFVTLRSEKTEALSELVKTAGERARSLAEEYGLGVETRLCDVFPATVNDGGLLDDLEKGCLSASLPYRYLDVPFRWSEDFGHYASGTKAAFFGIGSGEDTAPLHTKNYEYPDELLPIAAGTFYAMLKNI